MHNLTRGQSLNLHPYFVHESGEKSGESANLSVQFKLCLVKSAGKCPFQDSIDLMRQRPVPIVSIFVSYTYTCQL